MNTDTQLNFFTVFIFLGLVQGVILSYFFILKGGKRRLANVFQGLLIFGLACTMFEEFLNETGYIVQVLWLSDFSEPINFAFPPLFYLFIRTSLKLKFRRADIIHFVPFLFWLGMMYFHFSQPEALKYNSYVGVKHPEWPMLDVDLPYSPDPLGLRSRIPILFIIQFFLYMFFAIRLIWREGRKHEIDLIRTSNPLYLGLRNFSLHFLAIITIFILVKSIFQGDVGDYLISSYISFMFFSSTYRILNKSDYFKQDSSFLDFPIGKYRKSTLSEEEKDQILAKIREQMKVQKFFLGHMASMEGLAAEIRCSKHHVSQVINEKLNMNFFEMLANYRIEEATMLLEKDKENRITIEDLADQVGYNSKSAFNNAFKRITGLTPSAWRNKC